MKNKPRIIEILSLVIIMALSFYPVEQTSAVERDELEEQIQEKNKELQTLSSQIQQTQSTIVNLQGEAQTLSNAIAGINKQIDQVSYGIRSSEVGIEKFALQLESLGFKLEDVTAEIEVSQLALSEVLRNVQQKDNEGLLEVLLKHDSLADSVFEIQSLADLQDTLNVNVAQLSALEVELSGTINETASKKDELEDEHLTLRSRKEILADQQEEKDRVLSETKSEESTYQTRLQQLRLEQQKILDEISNIEEQLKSNFDSSSLPTQRQGLFVWPVTLVADGGAGRISQHYGETAYSTQYYKGKPHNGTDIAAPIGTKIYAAAAGKVIRVDYNGWYYQYGRYILIDHGNNITTLYAHLSQSAVATGQSVEQGELIGYVGNTGFTTGPHLHFGAYATPVGGWREVMSRAEGGLVSVPPATGLVPIGVTLNPEDYL